MTKAKRVQVRFDESDYSQLSVVAREEGTSVSGVVRKAVAGYLKPYHERRSAALKSLLSMESGIDPGSPEDIKAEIIRGMDEYLDRKLNLPDSSLDH